MIIGMKQVWRETAERMWPGWECGGKGREGKRRGFISTVPESSFNEKEDKLFKFDARYINMIQITSDPSGLMKVIMIL